MSLLIGVSGKAGAGKDTVAKLLQSLDNELENKKFSEKLKTFVSDVLRVPRAAMENEEFKKSNLESQWDMFHELYKGPKPFEVCVDVVKRPMTVRELLIRVGDGLRKVAHPDFWVNAEMAALTPNSKWIFTDVRYHNEKTAIEDKGGFVIRVDRPGIVEIDSETERHLDNSSFDYRIYNNGDLETLSIKVKEIYDDIKGRTGTVAINK
jgi:hypothetical protein